MINGYYYFISSWGETFFIPCFANLIILKIIGWGQNKNNIYLAHLANILPKNTHTEDKINISKCQIGWLNILQIYAVRKISYTLYIFKRSVKGNIIKKKLLFVVCNFDFFVC